MGFWQFTQATGRKFGLTITADMDERRNLYASTDAAIRYFQTLYDLFGSWTLSAAAYNMGEEGLEAEILAQKTDSYYQLYLPLETQRFVFRILSAKLVMAAPARFGFQLSPKDLWSPRETDPIRVECRSRTPLRLVAAACDTHFKEIKDLNPELRGHYIPAGIHLIRIPKGAATGFQNRFEKLCIEWREDREQHWYVVQSGDTLSGIADRFKVPLPALLIWNRIALKDRIFPGERLIVHPGEKDPDGG